LYRLETLICTRYPTGTNDCTGWICDTNVLIPSAPVRPAHARHCMFPARRPPRPLVFPFLSLFSSSFFLNFLLYSSSFNHTRYTQMNSTTIKIAKLQSQFDSRIELNPFKNYKNQSQTSKNYKNRRTTRFTCMPRSSAALGPRRPPCPRADRRLLCRPPAGKEREKELEID
jgi:hypothetical protein